MAGQLPSKYNKSGNTSAKLNIQKEVEAALDRAVGKLLAELRASAEKAQVQADKAESAAIAALSAEARCEKSRLAAESAAVQIGGDRIKAGQQLRSVKQVLQSIQKITKE
jgi:hypothetical protein